MKRLVGLVILSLFLLGCSNQDATNDSFNSADTNFAEMMIPHHEQALEMSALALANSENSDLRRLAQEIRDAQSPEIELMSSWPGVDPGKHSGHMMAGMLSGEEIQTLRESRGPTFDRLFLEGMIKHHEGAILMAQVVVDSKNEVVRNLAKEIISTQENEIRAMRDLLADL